MVAVFQVLRFPWIFIACADALAGYFMLRLFAGAEGRLTLLPYLAAAGIAATLAGSAWGEVFGLASARRLAPDRPLPSGRIGLTHAFLWAAALTYMALMLPMPAGTLSFVVGIALIACHLLDPAGLRRIEVVGPLLFGATRGLTMLLGMSAFPQVRLMDESALVGPALLSAFTAVAVALVDLERPWPPRKKRPKPAAQTPAKESAPAAGVIRVETEVETGAPAPAADAPAADDDHTTKEDARPRVIWDEAVAPPADADSPAPFPDDFGRGRPGDEVPPPPSAWQPAFGQAAVSRYPLPSAAFRGQGARSAPSPEPAPIPPPASPVGALPPGAKPPGEAPVNGWLVVAAGLALLFIPWGTILLMEWKWLGLVLVVLADLLILGRWLAALARPTATTVRQLANTALVASILLDAALVAGLTRFQSGRSFAGITAAWLENVPLPAPADLALILFVSALILPTAALRRRMPLV